MVCITEPWVSLVQIESLSLLFISLARQSHSLSLSLKFQFRFFAALVLVASAVFGRCCRRILRVSASAPALVIFNILFLWGVYIALIREGFPSLKDVVVNAEFTVLVIGLYSILSGDPGFISYDDSCLDRLNQSVVSNISSRSEVVKLDEWSGCCLCVPGIGNYPWLQPFPNNEGGISSVYMWEDNEDFVACYLITKDGSKSGYGRRSYLQEGAWDAFHVIEYIWTKLDKTRVQLPKLKCCGIFLHMVLFKS